MKQRSIYIFFYSTLIFALLFSLPISIRAQEVEDEREFDYIQGSAKGPEHWGEIKKEWADCKAGDLQSPVDLSSRRVKVLRRLGELKKNYTTRNATIVNRGHDIMVKWEGYNNAGSLNIRGRQYFLQQCHWHSPSEHTINGRRYAMELHMVHVSQDHKVAVIGLLYKTGKPDDFLSKLLGDITSMTDQKFERKMGLVDPSEIKMGGKKYYRYMGSLTTPPCTQGVVWTINKKIRTVSRDQIRALRIAVHDYAERNARPLQSLNKRDVHLYSPKPEDTSN